MKNCNKRNKGVSLLLKAANYTVIDFETTGQNVNSCEIIEMSAVRVRDDKIVDTYTTLIKPQVQIPYQITRLTGITNDMVLNAPTIYDILKDFVSFLGDDILLGHNIASFDSNILYDNALRVLGCETHNDFIDTLNFAKHCNLDVPNYQLTTLQDLFGVTNEAQHRSFSDCVATHECYQKMKPLFIPSVSVASSKRTIKSVRSEDTQNIIMLKGLLTGITCDDYLTEGEFYSLKNWVDRNQQLIGTYPFDVIIREIKNALADGILEQNELDFMLDVFKSVLDPVESFSEKGDCSEIDFSEKLICLTGDFENFDSRNEAEEYFISKGAIIKGSVVKKLDYLIVGGCGSGNWSCGNYGNKVKKALELQNQGASIKILKEEEVIK